MTDVSHELGALRFVVESPLSSKVAMFNNQATQHKQSQLLNPFSQHDGRASSPKPQFSKDQYGKPLVGSLTEMRGQKANMHVMKEMLELCQIIHSEGYEVKDEPKMRVIPFGELFNIYNYISDKVVGLLLRARKHKLVEFEGEMLFQRRDDNVPIFLLKPVLEIRREIEAKIEEIKRAASPAPPQSTSVLLDKSAHEQRLKVQKDAQSKSNSRTPSPASKPKSKSASPQPAPEPAPAVAKPPTAPVKVAAAAATEILPAPQAAETTAAAAVATATANVELASEPKLEVVPAPEVVQVAAVAPEANASTENVAAAAAEPAVAESAELPTIVIEASAVFVRTVSVDKTPETSAATEAAGPASSDN